MPPILPALAPRSGDTNIGTLQVFSAASWVLSADCLLASVALTPADVDTAAVPASARAAPLAAPWWGSTERTGRRDRAGDDRALVGLAIGHGRDHAVHVQCRATIAVSQRQESFRRKLAARPLQRRKRVDEGLLRR